MTRISMAAEATTTKFQNPDFRPDFHPDISVTAHDGLHFWQFMIAGSIAGSVEHMAMFPVDTIKTHMQALGSCPVKSVSVSQALRSILQSEGPSALYRGIAAMGLGAGPAHAVYFSVYEVCKKYFSGDNPKNSIVHAVSGVCATVSSDAVFTPMDMVKQRLQLGNNTYKGVWDCVKRVLREEGFGAFYASYRTTVLMNAPFTAVHFATYEATKRGLMEISPESANDERLVVHATAGAAAGALAAAVTTPLDVVKTQLQCQCLFQDLTTKQIIGKGRESGGLYIMENQSSCVDTPSQNGVAERKNRHLLEVTKLNPKSLKCVFLGYSRLQKGPTRTPVVHVYSRGLKIPDSDPPPAISLGDPVPHTDHDSDIDLPITLRKGKRSCTYPISSFVSYNQLSSCSRCFVTSLGSVPIPNTVGETLSHPGWYAAMKEEMEALDANGTWELLPLPTGHQFRVTICSHYPAQERHWPPTGRFNLDQHRRRRLNPLIPPLCAIA
ncbi:uncharacterized protein LOC131177523 isoform X3 [Hevea brasiliensis]|uniref:uncharacterized protein LOC131177523 isoform X3 n=1 Tax=Hevea brasiliensis TaxID=3981 RepID=UPI0025CEE6D5|nr:uncharacterized protein LOC131177523 isoform X3 [Hevea brasiliensis]